VVQVSCSRHDKSVCQLDKSHSEDLIDPCTLRNSTPFSNLPVLLLLGELPKVAPTDKPCFSSDVSSV
jgi:hypothetical protein